MKILVLNGSPKGEKSVTLQTVLYLEKRFPSHAFEFLNIGQKIKAFEKDFSKAEIELRDADMILFAYPVYTFIAPFQMHRFIELLKEHAIDISGKYIAQLTTSKHFYDITAHKYIEENSYDLGLKYLGGLSADMDDLQTEKGQKEADSFFIKLLFDIEHNIYTTTKTGFGLLKSDTGADNYTPKALPVAKTGTKDVVIVSNASDDDENLNNMIQDFQNLSSHPVRVVNIRNYPFAGGCISCFRCNISGKCIYKDGFDDYLRSNIQNADALFFAFTIKDHYTHSSFKCYDDRQFCNGHRSVTHGKMTGYLISGDYQNETNVKMIVEAKSDVSGMYLCGVATDEHDTYQSILNLAQTLDFAFENHLQRPQSFYGVGGSKIFRDLVYLMQGFMQADHKFYAENGVYDFPQNKKKMIFGMKLLGLVMKIPSVQREMYGKMNEYILMPYQKILDQVEPHDDK